jgi:hypothetical protein
MAIDRGGLRYEIEVVTKNLASLKALRKELRETFVAQSKVTKTQLNAARKTAALAKANAQAVVAQERAKKAAIETRIARQKLAKAISDQLRAQKQLENAARRTERSQRRATVQAVRQEGVLRRMVARLRAVTSETRRLGRAQQSTAAASNDLFFKFRRLVGTLAIFQAARIVSGGFTRLLTNMLKFRAAIEATQIGVAGLLTNIVQIRDTTDGRLLTGGEKFKAAMQLSAEFTRKLRGDALRTTATFEELARAAQEGLAPALTAGLSLDEARKVSVLISQAATALTIPQNQLGEEIRSILSGTASERMTRTAKAFGMSATELNKLVKEATAQGRLFEFIEERLQGTAQAAEIAALSFSGLFARSRDAILFMGSEASVSAFDEIKKQLTDLIDFLAPKDDEGNVIANPDALRALQPLFKSIANIVKGIRAEFDRMSAKEITAGFAAIGKALEVAARGIFGLVNGLITGMSDIAVISAKITGTWGEAAEGAFPRILSLIGRIVAYWVTWKVIALATSKVIIGPVVTALRVAWWGTVRLYKAFGFIGTKAIPFLYKGLAKLANLIGRGLAKATDALTKRWLLYPALIAAVGVALKKLVEYLLGFSLTWSEFADVMGMVWDNLLSKLKLVWSAIKTTFIKGWNGLQAVTKDGIASLLEQIAKGLSWIDEELGKGVAAAAKRIRESAEEDREEALKAQQDLQRAYVEFGKKQLQLEQQMNALRKKKREEEEKRKKEDEKGFFESVLSETAGLVDSAFSSLLEKLGIELPKAIEEGLDSVLDPWKDEFIQSFGDGIEEQLLKSFGTGERLMRPEGFEAIPKGPKELTEEEKFKFLLERKKLINQIADLERTATQQRIADLNLQLLLLQRQAELIQQAAITEAEREEKLNNIALKQELVQRQLEKLGEGGADEGMAAGIDSFIKNQDAFVSAAQIMEGALNSFADTFVDILESPKDAGEKLLAFFKGIVKQIIAMLTRLALAKALQGLGFGAVEGGPIGAGKQTGGLIGAHAKARGYADGGKIAGPRPPGLDPRDTVPIWAQPGEFMQPVSAVRQYGKQFMEAVRSRALPAPLMKALGSLAMGGRVPKLASRGPGYAVGGQVAVAGGPPAGAGGQVIEIRSVDVVNDGLSRDTLRTVSPGIKEPRNVAESKGGN